MLVQQFEVGIRQQARHAHAYAALAAAGSVERDGVSGYDMDIKVACMGCVVNGPGEAREADIGIAGGKGEGLLIKKGEILRKVPESELLAALKYELDNWGE